MARTGRRAKFKQNYDVVWYRPPIRDEWKAKIDAIDDLDDAIAQLLNFRDKHCGPFRTGGYELQGEKNWIEARLEEQVSVLKSAKYKGADFLNKTADGRDSQDVVDIYLDRMAKTEDSDEALAITMECRNACKPPIMPINYFMFLERELVSKLMKLRGLDYFTRPMEELRKVRGVTAVI